MKRTLIPLIFLTFTLIVNAQEKLDYNINNKNIEFIISSNEIYVEFAPSQKTAIEKIKDAKLKESTEISAILKIDNLKGNFQKRKEELKSKNSINFQRIEPVLIFKDGTRQVVNGELNVKLKANNSLISVLKGREFTFQPNEFEKDLYSVNINLATSEIFQLINQLQKDKRIEFIEPNFIRMIEPNTIDPFYASQWSINNQGYLNGTIDADMDVNDAWAYATGTGIKVAILDTGVDLTHPDLQGNLLSGFDATGGNNNGNQTGNAHGTACAGIVAAVANNNSGVAGIAYNAKIIPVKVFPAVGSPTDIMIANGINWAWQNGADVLSNSYGGGSYSNTIENAINNAVNNGRNGKGSIVLFSSGNDLVGNGNLVSFPANVNNAIAVGATTMCDTRKTRSSCDGESWWASNFGTQIDLVAPGVKIYTTDISGSGGYYTGDYTSDFNGTSSACPNAAGVVALILAANPNLTQQEARGILERNTDKVNGYSYSNTSGQPNGTWNSEVGYGRVNALKAVEEAQGATISGPDLICSGSSYTYTLQNPPSTVIWNTGSEVTVISQTNSTITVQASGSNVRGSGFVEINGGATRKDFYVGKPKTYAPAVPIICTNNRDQVEYILPESPGATSYQLISSSSNLKINGSTNYTFLSAPTSLYFRATIPGSYTVTIKTTNSCGTSTSAFPVEAEYCPSTRSFYSVYPNPASSEISIQGTSEIPASGMMNDFSHTYKAPVGKLYNFQGIFLKEVKLDPYGTISLDVSNLFQGYYFLKIPVRPGEEETHKIIVKH